jgi:predicted nucleotidyltransferase
MSTLSVTDRRKIQKIAAQYQVASVRLFGSQARGQASISSDIDLLVRFTQTASLFQMIGLKQAIEDALKKRVDLAEEGGISPYLRDRILSEALPL